MLQCCPVHQAILKVPLAAPAKLQSQLLYKLKMRPLCYASPLQRKNWGCSPQLPRGTMSMLQEGGGGNACNLPFERNQTYGVSCGVAWGPPRDAVPLGSFPAAAGT